MYVLTYSLLSQLLSVPSLGQGLLLITSWWIEPICCEYPSNKVHLQLTCAWRIIKQCCKNWRKKRLASWTNSSWFKHFIKNKRIGRGIERDIASMVNSSWKYLAYIAIPLPEAKFTKLRFWGKTVPQKKNCAPKNGSRNKKTELQRQICVRDKTVLHRQNCTAERGKYWDAEAKLCQRDKTVQQRGNCAVTKKMSHRQKLYCSDVDISSNDISERADSSVRNAGATWQNLIALQMGDLT